MNRYAILRSVESSLTREDLDAMAIENLVSLGCTGTRGGVAFFEPRIANVTWVRTYWQPGSEWAMCLYTADSPGEIKDYHELCDVPYVEFNPVVGYRSGQGTDARTEHTALPPGDHALFVVDAKLGGRQEMDERAYEDLGALFERAGGPLVRREGALDGARWIRSYWDAASGAAVALYAAPSAETIEALRSASAGSDVVIRPVVEVTPEEYLQEAEA